MKIIVTGAAGFIASTFVRQIMQEHEVLVIDALTYAGHKVNINELLSPRFQFQQINICDFEKLKKCVEDFKPNAFYHFAAESHVDNSIKGPLAFIQTNILGTFNCLEACRFFWQNLDAEAKSKFRYIQVSTDEVYGSLGAEGQFNEELPYRPNSPYSASKASSDHLARAWFHTYGMPTIITNCSNNYGPRQFPEKLIPRMILNALSGKPLPVYGTGKNIRDWIHVEDHSRGVYLAGTKGQPGEVYCFGGNSERTNLQVVESICNYLNKIKPPSTGDYKTLIAFVEDRAGHDWRYAIDDRKAEKNLGFKKHYTSFESGLEKTIDWYIQNQHWVQTVSKS